MGITRNVNVLSGHIGSGKSYLLRKLRDMPEFADAWISSLDEVRFQYWNGSDLSELTEEERIAEYGKLHRLLSDTERVFANMVTRREIQNQLIIKKKHSIL